MLLAVGATRECTNSEAGHVCGDLALATAINWPPGVPLVNLTSVQLPSEAYDKYMAHYGLDSTGLDRRP